MLLSKYLFLSLNIIITITVIQYFDINHPIFREKSNLISFIISIYSYGYVSNFLEKEKPSLLLGMSYSSAIITAAFFGTKLVLYLFLGKDF